MDFSGGLPGVLIVSCSLVGSIQMVLLVRRIFSPEDLRQFHDIRRLCRQPDGNFYAVYTKTPAHPSEKSKEQAL